MSKNPIDDVVKKALTDAAFRAELLKNPGAAVSKATGVILPAGVTIKVVEDSASSVHLVLPHGVEKGELKDDDLGHVAGGSFNPNQHAGLNFPGATQKGFCTSSSNSAPCGPFGG